MDSELYGNAPAPQHFGITPPTFAYLHEVAKWGKFLAIVGFILIGIMVISSLFAGAAMGDMFLPKEAADSMAGAVMGGFVSIFYLLIALLYFFPVLYLYRFSGKLQEALRLQDEGLLAGSFANLKSLFRFMGILTIIMLAFYGLGMLFMFLGFGIGSMM